ncbi:MAG: hypothetical protein ACYS0E_03220 [Planctomycetota bacterium]|jgi:hypothetical protein
MKVDSELLSPAQMQLFVAGLSGLPPEEVNKAKVLYLRNAVSEYNAAKESARGMPWMLIPFWIIPIFWPMLFIFLRNQRIELSLARERIENAADVWKEDLGGSELLDIG